MEKSEKCTEITLRFDFNPWKNFLRPVQERTRKNFFQYSFNFTKNTLNFLFHRTIEYVHSWVKNDNISAFLCITGRDTFRSPLYNILRLIKNIASQNEIIDLSDRDEEYIVIITRVAQQAGEDISAFTHGLWDDMF